MEDKLLRSVILKDLTIEKKDELLKNYSKLVKSNVRLSPVDQTILDYIKTFYNQHNEVPTLNILRDHFNRQSRSDISNRLDDVEKETPSFDVEYDYLISSYKDIKTDEGMESLLRETNLIRTQGKKFGKETKKGVRDAYYHFLHEGSRVLDLTNEGSKVSGCINEDTQEVIEEYLKKKGSNKYRDVVFTGFDPIDEVCGGLKKKELLLWLGYTSDGKTTCCLNMAYNAAAYGGANVLIYSLEMSYEQLRNIFITLHSCNTKFRNQFNPISYTKLEMGELDPEEEHFLANEILPDLEKNDLLGRIRVEYATSGFTIADLRASAELIHRENPIDLLIVDYVQLLSPERGVRFANHAEALNFTIKELKQLSMTFNRGEGMRVVSPYQASRAGRVEAEKSEGNYTLRALSQANESERSADIVAYSYLSPELRDSNMIKMGVIKNRSRPLIEQFEQTAILSSRYIGRKIDGGALDPEMIFDSENFDL